MSELLKIDMQSKMKLQFFLEKMTIINDLTTQYMVVRSDTPPVMLHSPMPPCYPYKCPSCGSHQFVMHANRRICSYCRSEA